MGAGRTAGRPGRRWPLVAGALVAGLVGLVAALASAGALLVHACVPGDGAVGVLGLRLAVLGPDPDCPVGTLAVGADAPGAARLVVLVALPVLLAHVLAALAGVSVLVVVRTAWHGVLRVLRSAARRLPAAPPRVPRRTRAVPPAPADGPRVRPLPSAVRRRGPPLLLPA